LEEEGIRVAVQAGSLAMLSIIFYLDVVLATGIFSAKFSSYGLPPSFVLTLLTTRPKNAEKELKSIAARYQK
jgi:hypothetical protein